jgi:hypothetical protein
MGMISVYFKGLGGGGEAVMACFKVLTGIRLQ